MWGARLASSRRLYLHLVAIFRAPIPAPMAFGWAEWASTRFLGESESLSMFAKFGNDNPFSNATQVWRLNAQKSSHRPFLLVRKGRRMRWAVIVSPSWICVDSELCLLPTNSPITPRFTATHLLPSQRTH